MWSPGGGVLKGRRGQLAVSLRAEEVNGGLCHLLGQKQVSLLNSVIKVMPVFGTKDRQVCHS